MASLEALAEALSAAEGGAASTAVLFPLEVCVVWSVGFRMMMIDSSRQWLGRERVCKCVDV
jgi:hypothetical protein